MFVSTCLDWAKIDHPRRFCPELVLGPARKHLFQWGKEIKTIRGAHSEVFHYGLAVKMEHSTSVEHWFCAWRVSVSIGRVFGLVNMLSS